MHVSASIFKRIFIKGRNKQIDNSDNLDLLEILSNYSMRDIIPVI